MVQYKAKLDRLAKALSCSKNMVLGAFTATPNVESPADGRALLDIVKGSGEKSMNDEGFVSYFDSLPPALFPIVKKGGRNNLGVVHVIQIEGEAKGENLFKYKEAVKKFGFTGANMPDNKKDTFRLYNFSNLSSSYSHITQAKWPQKYAKDPRMHGSKLRALAKMIGPRREKALVLVDRKAGYKALVEAFQVAAAGAGWKSPRDGWCGMYEKSDMSKLQKFNSKENLRGDLIRVMVVDAQEFSEGVSFLACRQLYLLNPPINAGAYFQQVGRVVRSCGHHPLKPAERDVTINFLLGDPGQGVASIDEVAYLSLGREVRKYEEEQAFFESIAVDRKIMRRFNQSSSPKKRSSKKKKKSLSMDQLDEMMGKLKL